MITAIEAREEGIAHADQGATTAFKKAAYDAIEHLALTKHEVFVDDVWAKLGSRCPATRDKRAMGPVMRRAAKAGLIRADRLQASAQVQCHANLRTVWTSLVYDPS